LLVTCVRVEGKKKLLSVFPPRPPHALVLHRPTRAYTTNTHVLGALTKGSFRVFPPLPYSYSSKLFPWPLLLSRPNHQLSFLPVSFLLPAHTYGPAASHHVTVVTILAAAAAELAPPSYPPPPHTSPTRTCLTQPIAPTHLPPAPSPHKLRCQRPRHSLPPPPPRLSPSSASLVVVEPTCSLMLSAVCWLLRFVLMPYSPDMLLIAQRND
jgi:hypothetical protein